MAVASVAVALIPLAAKNIVTLFLICIIIGASEYCLASLVDCWCIKLSEKHPVNFGMGRAVGSLGYAITALIFGYIFARMDMQITFYMHFIACAICLILILKTEGVPPIKGEAVVQKKKSTFGKDVCVLLKNRQYVIFVLCAAMTFIGSSATISFLSSLLELRGGTAEHLGYALFIQAGFEVPFMLMSAWLIKKFNIKFLLVFAFFAYIIKYLAPALMPSVWGIILVQSLQGISFGIFLPAAMKYLALISPEGLKGTATTLAVAVYVGIGNIAGNAIGGLIADNLGVQMVYILSAILACCSAVIFLLFGFSRKSAIE
ncbi:MAG: MFS transporter, partial [Oscillospiraceae bacterium]